jgi:hypothetical protein
MTPLDPTPSGGRGAQGGSRASRSSRDGHRRRAEPRAALGASMASTPRSHPLRRPSTVARKALSPDRGL